MKRLSLALACVSLFGNLLRAQTASAPPAPQDIQARAEAMLAKSRQLSDIRAPNAPAFHLKATFTFPGEGLEIKSATYEEFWVSSSQWRREIAVGDIRHVEVRANSKTYVRDNPALFPGKAKEITSAMQMFPASSVRFDFESIRDLEDQASLIDCPVTKPGTWQEKRVFCVERERGLLLEKVYPVFQGRSALTHSCNYSKFEKFGDAWFPREIVCFEGNDKIIAANVDELSLVVPPNPDFFLPPSGATELDVCTGTSHPPVVLSSREPEYPVKARNGGGVVNLSVRVDVNGRSQDIRVLSPTKKEFDQAATKAVKDWRFKPGTCDGEPMVVEISFHRDH